MTLPKTTKCPTCQGAGEVPLMFGTCPVTPMMAGELTKILAGKTFFSKVEMDLIRSVISEYDLDMGIHKPDSMTDIEWAEFCNKFIKKIT